VPIRSRLITLDGSGAGYFEAPTCAYAGCIDSGSAVILANQGFPLTRGPLKHSDWVPVAGSIHVTNGAPNQNLILFFDF
jgi:hypothetical protein